MDLSWSKVTTDKKNSLVPINGRMNGAISSFSSRQLETCCPAIKTLMKSQNGRNGITEKSSFVVELNGDNGTMVSFKLHTTNDIEDNEKHITTQSFRNANQKIKSALDEDTQFKSKQDLKGKNDIYVAKSESDTSPYSEKNIPQNNEVSDQTRKNGFKLDENETRSKATSTTPILLNNGINGKLRKMVINKNHKRGKPPLFPLHEKIYQRYQLESLNNIEEYQTVGDDSQFTMEYTNLHQGEAAINNTQNEIACDVENEEEHKTSKELNNDSSKCRVYKPWLMLESTDEDLIENEVQEEDEEPEMDSRYLTPDYRHSPINVQIQQQKKIEKRVHKSLKQLIAPHNNTYSSFETKVVDGLRQVIADKSNIESNKDRKAVFDDKPNYENENTLKDISLEENNKENIRSENKNGNCTQHINKFEELPFEGKEKVSLSSIL